jgi:hypothetical protein
MSTRCLIAKDYGNKFKAIYCHWDGYPSYTGIMLYEYYKDDSVIDELLALGDISYLAKNIKPKPNEIHSFENPVKDVVVAYHRDRGEDICIREFENLTQLFDNAHDSWCEFLYLWRNQEWEVYDISANPLKNMAYDFILKDRKGE